MVLSLRRNPILVLALCVCGFRLGIAAEPWWHTYTPLVSSPTRIKNIEAVRAGAARGAGYHSGWYGFWSLDDQRRTAVSEQTCKRMAQLGLKHVWYYDSGEVGDYAGFFGKDGKMLYNGWSLPWWKGEPMTARWFGLSGFMQNVGWAPWPTAKDYHLPPFAMPDGRSPADVYDALSRRDMEGKWKFDYFSNPRVTDEIAEKTGLASIGGQQEGKEDVQGKTGWETTRLVHVDYANPQLRDYRCREIAWLIPQIKPEGIHIDNHGDLNLVYPSLCAFGEWSVHGFRQWMRERFNSEQLRALGIGDIDTFDIRAYIRDKPFDTRGKRAAHLLNPKWTEDPVWLCYLLSKVESGVAFHRAVYRTAKEAAKAQGLDCMVGGNTIPLFPGRPLLRGACDIANFEWKTVGRFGPMPEMGLPPKARVGYVTRLGAAISDAPYCWPSIYVPKNLSGEGHENLHKVLAFDCLANRAILDFGQWFLDGYPPGTPESAGFVNRFIAANADLLSRRGYMADVGVVHSTWSEVASITPLRFTAEGFTDEYAGWCHFLNRSHRQWDVILDQDLRVDVLRRFPIVVLPSAMTLTDEQASQLKQYVESGGRLIATGPTGTRHGPDRYLAPRKGNALETLAHHPKVRIVTDRPGAAYGLQEENKAAAQQMADLLAWPDCLPCVETDAPMTVGVNANTGQDAKGPFVTIDLNNYDIEVESDTIRSAPRCSVTVRLPELFRSKTLRACYVHPEMDDPEQPAILQDTDLVLNAAKGVVTVRTPSLETFGIICIRP
ncbi:MAG: beta-galactosidase trimerization domain-containing protein [Planctomycetota bacterium]